MHVQIILILVLIGISAGCDTPEKDKNIATSSMESLETDRSQGLTTTGDSVYPSEGIMPGLPIAGVVHPQPKPEAVKGYRKLTWEFLRDVSFEDKYYEAEDLYFLYPTYGDEITYYEGKDIFLSGYLIPINPDSNMYVLSANPFSSCYFCGNAGPESIVELALAEELGEGYVTDQWLAFKGALKLNAEDLNHLYYIIENATEVPIEK